MSELRTLWGWLDRSPGLTIFVRRTRSPRARKKGILDFIYKKPWNRSWSPFTSWMFAPSEGLESEQESESELRAGIRASLAVEENTRELVRSDESSVRSSVDVPFWYRWSKKE
jgi:hypothetical protein